MKLKNTSVYAQSFDYFNGKLIVVYNPLSEIANKERCFEREEDLTEKYLGYSLIYHNTDMSDADAVKKYYERDVVERAFKQLNGVLSIRPVRVWLKEHIQGHVRICYLAYAILALMNYRLKKLHISAVDALNSLKHGYKVNLLDESTQFKWDLIVPLEPKQHDILKALNVVYKK